MKELVLEVARSAPDTLRGRLLVTEYFQVRVLGFLQSAGAMVPLAFQGGTALRFIYALDRFSEDLDFALERRPDLYDLGAIAREIESGFRAEAYAVDITFSTERTVNTLWVRFPGLLREIGLSPHESAKLAIKLEVDTRPPQGADLTTTVVRRHLVVNLQHHDKASLLAGKLHAVLARPHPKGRDLYDLLWYLADPSWPEPNLTLLRNTLVQTEWPGELPSEGTWRALVLARVSALDWRLVQRDVEPFIENAASAEAFTQEALVGVLTARLGR